MRFTDGKFSDEYVNTLLADDGLTLSGFWDALSAWSQATFGSDRERGPAGPLKHLAKEVEEAMAEPGDVEEYADLLFLVFDAARRAGFSHNDLRVAANKKLKKNMARKWPKPTTDGAVEHVRDGEQ